MLRAIAAAGAALVLAACGGGEDAGSGAAEFDRAFIDAMVPHHESALEMADTALDAGLDQPELVQVARDVLRTQQQEIDRMKAWRADWFGSAEIDPGGGAALGLNDSDQGMEHDASSLRSSTDVDLDFARLMAAHHEGAVRMAKLAQERAEHEELRELAGAIRSAQEREIEVLRPHAGGHGH